MILSICISRRYHRMRDWSHICSQSAMKLCFILCFGGIIHLLQAQSISITTSGADISLGDSAQILVTVDGNMNNITVWPFVNSSQWSADQPLQYNSTSKKSETILLIPFAFTGKAKVIVSLLHNPPFNGNPFTVGLPLPSSVQSQSNTLQINVKDESSSSSASSTTLGLMFYETWFTPSHHHWQLAEAIPLIGRYSSYDTSAMKQHALWLNNIGINGVVIDWTNNLYGKTSWLQRDIIAQEMINATTDLFAYYNTLRSHKILNTTPSIVLLLGLSNGSKNTTIVALQEEIQWITDNYYSKYPDLFVIHEHKPLLIIWDGTNLHYKVKPINNTQIYTIRWMTAHLNDNRMNDMGYLSWMDGSIDPVPTYYNNGTNTGHVESLTITPAFFGRTGGWLGPDAVATNNGATLLYEGISAARYLPTLLFVNQWNEFAGNSNRNQSGFSYLDIYNSTLGQDIEPTSLTQCGYYRPYNAYCGGWGFRRLNILKAIIYNVNINPNSYFMIIQNPVPWTTYSKSYNHATLNVSWVVLGKCNDNTFDIYVDQNKINTVKDKEYYNMDTSTLNNGYHSVGIVAVNCQTQLLLADNKLSNILNPPIVPTDAVSFLVQT
eukprot:92849_1